MGTSATTLRTNKRPFTGNQVRTLFAGFSGLCLSLWTLPTWAAQQITLTYPSLQPQTISVRSLETFAKDGTINPDLAPLVTLASPQQANQLRSFLRRQLDVPSTLVPQFSTTETGQIFFRRLGDIIKTENNQNGETALVLAAQKAAAAPQGLTLTNLLRQFPGQTVNVDGQLGLQAIAQVVTTVGKRNQVISAIAKQSQAAPSVPLPTQIDLRQPGNVPWQKQTLVYFNPDRLPDSRRITADIYLPRRPTGPTPVVVISHGVGSDRSTFSYLAEHLASYGFVVAVPEHPDSASTRVEQLLTGQVSNDVVRNGSDILNRPLDIRYLLDAMVQRRGSDPSWRTVDTQQVGVIGQSLGGYTALAIAGARIDYDRLRQECPRLRYGIFSLNISSPLQCSVLAAPANLQRRANFRDPRVRGVIAVNPLTNLFFGPSGIGQIQVPTLMIAGGADLFAPPLEEQITPFTWLKTRRKYLLVLERGTHFSLLGQNRQNVFAVPPELIGPNPALARPLLEAFSVAFLQSFIAGQPQYLPYLSQSYASTITQAPFRVDLVQSFTAEQLRQALLPSRTQSLQ